MKKKVIAECPECNGTGIYTESRNLKNGAAVFCINCGGTGKIEIKAFTGKKKVKGVTRVFERSHGYQEIFPTDHVVGNKVIHFSKYGCTYEGFLEGEDPKPIEELYCPRVHDKGNLEEVKSKMCARMLPPYDDPKKCRCNRMHDCWKIWHQEND